MSDPSEHHSSGLPAGHAQAADQRWRVLFIGNHGRVITFKRLKLVLGLVIATLALALAAGAVLVVVNGQLHGRNRDLHQRLAVLEKKHQALVRERDILTAQLVLVEARMNEVLSGTVPEKRPAPAAQEPPPETAPAAPAEGSAKRAPEAAAGEPPGGLDEGIEVEGLSIRYRPDRRTLELKYTIRNTDPGRKPLRAHAVIVLKSQALDPSQWLALPRADLVAGVPTGKTRGYPFTINYSKTFAQTAPAPKELPHFDAAVVYVFSNAGELLFAQDFEVDIRQAAG
jgi:hypothetical protein